jgi:hypothetical protein
LAGPRACPLRHRLGAWVIHFPVVVCTNSPSMITSLKLGPTVRGAK